MMMLARRSFSDVGYLATLLLSASVEFILSLSKDHSLVLQQFYSALCKCHYNIQQFFYWKYFSVAKDTKTTQRSQWKISAFFACLKTTNKRNDESSSESSISEGCA